MKTDFRPSCAEITVHHRKDIIDTGSGFLTGGGRTANAAHSQGLLDTTLAFDHAASEIRSGFQNERAEKLEHRGATVRAVAPRLRSGAVKIDLHNPLSQGPQLSRSAMGHRPSQSKHGLATDTHSGRFCDVDRSPGPPKGMTTTAPDCRHRPDRSLERPCTYGTNPGWCAPACPIN